MPMWRTRFALDLIARPRAIAYGEHRWQRADLHLPRGDGPHPVIVTIHGGGWGPRYSKVLMKGLAGDLRRRGYAVWNVEYRRLGGKGGGVPATLEDVTAAIDHLATLDAPLDLDHVIAIGHSAGGHLATWAAGRGNLRRGAPGHRPRVPLTGVVSQAGVVDLTSSAKAGGVAHDFVGGSPEEHPDRYKIADPIRLLPFRIPTLLVHGEADDVVPLKRSRDFVTKARQAGDEVELIELDGRAGRHQAHINPAGRSWAAVTEWLARQRE
ncbi:MAG TPA: alpha/beta fold hydrolase [Solirubrobacteraceae bacterium]|jgi:acetyl esterase/lipase|nr:alpha/beta fold hydrolase [Solirubrobacteraceae bacterium]